MTGSGGWGCMKERGKRRQMHIDSSQVEEALNPVRGVRDALRRQGIEPRNYAKSNREAVRQASQTNAMRRKQCLVESAAVRPKERRRSTAPPREITSEDAKSSHVLRNILEAGAKSKNVVGERNRLSSPRWTHKEGYGEVPSYLQMRKVELAAERDAKERAREAALCAPGMRIMEDEEQKEALEKIVHSKDNIEMQLRNLPLIIETPSLMKLKTELERRLVELEEAERIFSRPRVIVKV